MIKIDEFYNDYHLQINENHLVFDHQNAVGQIAHLLCRYLSFDAKDCDVYKMCAGFHDIGKMKTPHEILYKPGKLTPEEFEIMKLHVKQGHEILFKYISKEQRLTFTNIMLYHHENFDGTGYSTHLKGRQIPLESRITMICDVYHALREKRSYKIALDHDESLQAMIKMKQKFDYEILYEFMNIPEKFFDKIIG